MAAAWDRTIRRVAALAILGGMSTWSGIAGAQSPLTHAPTSDATLAGTLIPLDGMIGQRAAHRMRPRLVRRPAPRSDDPFARLADMMDWMLNRETVTARRHRAHPHKPAGLAQPLVAGPITPLEPSQTSQPVRPGIIAAPATSPLATGSLPPPAVPGVPADQADQLIVAAERSQLRADLVKLEFVSRTYDERKLAGQIVYAQRDDWRVLERAQDALTDAEKAGAAAAGFVANAYINETTRTIVVAVAGTQDLRRDFIAADIWRALIVANAPQHFYLAKTYVRSVIQRYQSQGFSTECVGHSLGGGACAYAAAELGIRALVLNPISAGRLAPPARALVTNYVVDGDIASIVYRARGNDFPGDVQVISDGRDAIRLLALQKYGQLAGPILVVRELRASVDSHKAEHALDLMAAQAETTRTK